jgi:hypothetical protein
MKKIFSAFAMIAISFFAASLGIAGDQDFALVNETGLEIYSVYVTPHSADDWGDDVLDVDTLPDGESVHIKFSRRERAKYWDLRIEDENGNQLDWEKLNLLEISTVTLYYKKGRVWADTE